MDGAGCIGAVNANQFAGRVSYLGGGRLSQLAVELMAVQFVWLASAGIPLCQEHDAD